MQGSERRNTDVHAWETVIGFVERLDIPDEPMGRCVQGGYLPPGWRSLNREKKEEEHLYNQQDDEADNGVIKLPEVVEGEDRENYDWVIDSAVNPYPPGTKLDVSVNETFQLNRFPKGIPLTPEIKLINPDDQDDGHDDHDHIVCFVCNSQKHGHRIEM